MKYASHVASVRLFLLCLVLVAVAAVVWAAATAPTVASTSPAKNAKTVDVATKITVTFSTAMDAKSSSAFQMQNGRGTNATPLTGFTTSWSDDATTLTIQPAQALPAGANIHCTITTDAKDKDGNALAAAYAWHFKTAPAPAPATN